MIVKETYQPMNVNLCDSVEIKKLQEFDGPCSYEIIIDGIKQEGIINLSFNMSTLELPTLTVERYIK